MLRTASSVLTRAGMAGDQSSKSSLGPGWEGDPEITAKHGMTLALAPVLHPSLRLGTSFLGR